LIQRTARTKHLLSDSGDYFPSVNGRHVKGDLVCRDWIGSITRFNPIELPGQELSHT
jgi:hypothetical protein